jgi:molecular chaperone GrpE
MDKNLEKNNDKENENNDEKAKKVEEITVEQKLKESEEKTLRSLAEIENQRRRFEKEVKDAFDFGGFNLAKETLSILDNLQRAKISIKNDQALKENKDLPKFLENIDIIEKDLISIFEKNKIIKINSIGNKFDPNQHQAMMEIEDNNAEPGTILQEIQPGYTYNKRLLRPSFVGVAKKKDEKNIKNDQKKSEEDLKN